MIAAQTKGRNRLSAYWYPLRTVDLGAANGGGVSDSFRTNARFEDAVALYVFDKKLRLLLYDALERIEIAIRTQLALQIGKVRDNKLNP